MHVIVDPTTLEKSRLSEVITGKICIQFRSHKFPDPDWSDYPVVILGWWLRSLVALQRGPGVVEELDFMDGPFLVRLSGGRSDGYSCEALSDRPSGIEIIHSGRVHRRAFLREVASAARLTLEQCQRNGWTNDDLDELEAALTDAADDLGRGA